MLVGTAVMSRVSASTGYALGVALPMIVFGIGQGLGLSVLTLAGMAGAAPRDAAVAGGLVNVAHHLGGALCLGILVTVFDAAGGAAHGRDLLADRVSAALTAACAFLVLALVVTGATHRRRRAGSTPTDKDPSVLAATASPAHPAAVALRERRA